jgi:hypothetical protein
MTMPVPGMMMPVPVWPPKVKGKPGPSPPPIIKNRRRWWRGGIPDYRSRRRTADLFHRFLHQRAVLPDSLAHPPAIGIIRPLGNGLNCMAALIVINHRLAMPGRISGRLIILIHGISHQGTENGPRGQPDEGSLCIASNGLADKRARACSHCGPDLGIVPVMGVVGTGYKGEREGQYQYKYIIFPHFSLQRII